MKKEKNATVQEAEVVHDEAWQKRRRRRMRALRSFLFRTILLALVVYVLFFHVVGLAVMPSGYMSPRVDGGDLLLFYRIDKTIKSRDIIVFDKVTDKSSSEAESGARAESETTRKVLKWLGFKEPNAKRYVCRVVACPGDTVEITDEKGLAVNGNILNESNIFSATQPYGTNVEYPLKLGPGEYFVLSDFRNGGGGEDSRYFGPVKLEEIQGIVITILRRNNL